MFVITLICLLLICQHWTEIIDKVTPHPHFLSAGLPPPPSQHHILSEMSSTVSQLCIPMSQHILQLMMMPVMMMMPMMMMTKMMTMTMTMARKQRPLLGLIFTGQHCLGPAEALKPCSTAQTLLSKLLPASTFLQHSSTAMTLKPLSTGTLQSTLGSTRLQL